MSPSEDIVNWELFLWALHILRGEDQFVDVEDVYVECFSIAPARFGWRTRPDLPDYKKCAKALQEAEARRPSLLIKTRDGLSRQLSVDGHRWIAANSHRFVDVSSSPVPEPANRPRARLLAELERSKPYQSWLRDDTIPSDKWQVAELLRCSPDSDTHVWRSRIETLRAAANSSQRDDLLAFLDTIMRTYHGWFGVE